MKTVRLDEADVTSTNEAKSRYESAETDEEKVDIVIEFLSNIINNTGVLNSIENFGESHVISWVNAMRWDELGRDDNEFIKLLNNIGEGSIPLSNFDNFSKIYNAYSDGSISNDYINDKNYLFEKMVLDNQLYESSDKEFREYFKIYDRLKSNSRFSDEAINEIFLENPRSPATSKFNLLAVVQRKANNGGAEYNSNDVENNLDAAKDMLDKLLNVEGIAEYLNSKGWSLAS